MVTQVKSVVPLLGKRQCPRGWTWNGQGNYCEQTSGGGSYRILKMPPLMYGAAVQATPANVTQAPNENGLTLVEDQAPTGGFDIMQWASDNALWLGVGVVGVIAIMYFSKKRR